MRRSLPRAAVAIASAALFQACGGSDGASPSDAVDASTTPSDLDASVGDGSLPDASDAGEDAGPPAVRFVGRWDTSDPAGPKVGWPGARILARFDGTEVTARFQDEPYNAEHGEWDVLVDGTKTAAPLVMDGGPTTYTLATGLAPGVHTIELWRRTEAMVSTTQFLGFDFGSGALLPPPPAKTRRLEFLTDSAGNGYGIDGAGPNCSFSAATENEHEAYPALMAIDLDADHHDLGYQGRGVYWNYVRTDPDVASVVYPRTLPTKSSSPAWDFTAFVPDVVWITLGGNDWDQPAANDPPPPLSGFEAAYASLVALVRTKHPGAHIVCAVATSLGDNYPPGYDAYTNVTTALHKVVDDANAAGDAKVHYFEFTRAVTATDLTGCEYHPNVQKHRKMADEAIAFVKSLPTGVAWP